VENRLTELWSIFDFINRGYLGSLPDFTRRFAVPIEKYRDREKISRLKRATAPFILRRLKTDRSVIKDLPDKVITNEYCHLTKEQAALYQQVVDAAMREIEKSDGIKRKGLIFRLITSLKQICNHPAHYTRKGNVAKELSGKAEKTVELVKKIILAGEKVLIFTQYREMGELLVEMIGRELKEDVLFFHGGLPRTKRDRLVEEFQGGDRHPVLVVSLKAGGTGLNLTAAANVIHYDLWWNPAVEAQATDRTYRIGQTKKVIVYRLITLGTFEEKIDEMLGAKKELAELTVAAGEQWITELSDRELLEIFRYAAGLEAV
ncbi:MAG: DEAD/DEAH box helicase, partial [Desulfotomaculales bacterium]